MKNFKMLLAVGMMVASVSACTRISTGEVGIRVDASNQIQNEELRPGSWNQTLIGSVLEFPVKDIVVDLENKTPLAADNSALQDFDITVVYNVNPSSVAELYSTKSRSFHTIGNEGILLMAAYMQTLVNNAAYKIVRKYNSLEVTDNRPKIEQEIREVVLEQLKTENLDKALSLSVVQVKSILPNAEILKSATATVKAQNELKVKTTEVEIAKKEAERMAALANNSQASIAYMNAQAALNISEGVRNGKVNTIIVPSNFTSLYTKN